MLELSYEELTWLGKAFEYKSDFSPFVLYAKDGDEAAVVKQLTDKGIVDSELKVSPKAYPILETMSKPVGYVEMALSKGPLKSRKTVLYGERDSLSLTILDKALEANTSLQIDAMQAFLASYLGDTQLRSSDLALELPIGEAMVLLEMMDLHRRAVLRSMSDQMVQYLVTLRVDAVLQGLEEMSIDTQSLSYFLYEQCHHLWEGTSGDLQDILDQLERRGLIAEVEDGYRLIDEALLFANQFLIVEQMLEIGIGKLDANGAVKSKALVLQAGVQDLVYLEASEQVVQLEAMASHQVLEMTKAIWESGAVLI